MQLESQTPSELRRSLWGDRAAALATYEDAPPYDYRPFRNRTILRTGDGRAIVMDPVLFTDKLAVGPLFLLARGEERRRGSSNQLFAAFGRAFEEYTCDILRRMFQPTSSSLARRLTCPAEIVDGSGTKLPLDGCLNDVTEAVLFEIKGVFLREHRILDQDPDSYVDALRDSYVTSRRDGGSPRPKGVAQLARGITALCEEGAFQRNPAFADVKRVYPVMLVHDLLIGTPLHGHFLASEFAELLKPDSTARTGQLRKGPLAVEPLIVMTVDDIEKVETSIEAFGFRELLKDYSDNDPCRLGTLRDHLQASAKYKGRLVPNRSLVDKTNEILRLAADALFPSGE